MTKADFLRNPSLIPEAVKALDESSLHSEFKRLGEEKFNYDIRQWLPLLGSIAIPYLLYELILKEYMYAELVSLIIFWVSIGALVWGRNILWDKIGYPKNFDYFHWNAIRAEVERRRAIT